MWKYEKVGNACRFWAVGKIAYHFYGGNRRLFCTRLCMSIKKIFYSLIIVALGAFLAKEITAERARGFIRECLSEREIEIILDEHANQERQFETVKRGIACVREKQ